MDGEFVLVDLASGKYFRIQSDSANTFSLVVSGQDLTRFSDSESNIPPSLSDAVRVLLEKEIIREVLSVTTEAQSHSSTDYTPEDFVLEEFTDLQDIIGLDPIHEVDLNQGWPIADSSR
jgi:hypothetical protein